MLAGILNDVRYYNSDGGFYQPAIMAIKNDEPCGSKKLRQVFFYNYRSIMPAKTKSVAEGGINGALLCFVESEI